MRTNQSSVSLFAYAVPPIMPHQHHKKCGITSQCRMEKYTRPTKYRVKYCKSGKLAVVSTADYTYYNSDPIFLKSYMHIIHIENQEYNYFGYNNLKTNENQPIYSECTYCQNAYTLYRGKMKSLICKKYLYSVKKYPNLKQYFTC